MTANGTAEVRQRPWFFADWRRFFFVHYAIRPDALAPFTPLPLDCREGFAFLSLVFFRLERMRPARILPPKLGRWICRLASDHSFLNLRTYVKGPGGPGIQFLAEWIDNRVSRVVGPLLYGLPYRLARLSRDTAPVGDPCRCRVQDLSRGGGLSFTFTDTGVRETPVNPMDELLLEQYTAYTVRAGAVRCFRVGHPPWAPTRAEAADIADTLLPREYPCVAGAAPIGAQAAPGFANVAMGPPFRCEPKPPAKRRRSRWAWEIPF